VTLAAPRCRVPLDWITDPSLCLFEWQTLISGFLAVAAAGVTVFVLKQQIAQSDAHERDRLRRQHDATRATLPLTLSGLTFAIEHMLSQLSKARYKFGCANLVKNFDPQPPPTEAIRELQQIIRSTDDPNVIQIISEIIRQMQILWARVRILSDEEKQEIRVGLSVEITQWIIEAAKIHALIGSLFDFARSRSQYGPDSVAWERVESVLMHLYIEDDTLKAIVKDGLEKSPYFWPAQ
jgi:hypothetical protein